MHACINLNRHTDIHHTHTHTYTDTQAQIYTDKETQTHTKDTHTHTHTHTHTLTFADPFLQAGRVVNWAFLAFWVFWHSELQRRV